MGRPTEIDDADILQAARQVFLGHGVNGTVLEVARRARISEASVFKRFKTKSALFRAAMQPDLELPRVLAGLHARAGQRPVAKNLEEAGHAVLDLLRLVLPAMMMAWSNRRAGGPDAAADGQTRQREMLQPLISYLHEEMKLGRLRTRDPEIVARALVGGIADYVVTETLKHGVYPTALSPQRYIRGLIDLILDGVAAPATRRSRRPPAKKDQP